MFFLPRQRRRTRDGWQRSSPQVLRCTSKIVRRATFLEYPSILLRNERSVTRVLMLDQAVTEERDVIDENSVLLCLTRQLKRSSFLISTAIKYWNKGAEQQYGWKQDDVRGVLSIRCSTQSFHPTCGHHGHLLRAGRWKGRYNIHSRRYTITVMSHWTLQYGARNVPVAILETHGHTERKQAEEKSVHLVYARSLIEASLDPLVTSMTERLRMSTKPRG